MEVLFTFPSRYWFTISLTGVFSLAGWARRIRAGLLVSRTTQDDAMSNHASNTGLSPSMAPLSRGFFSQSNVQCRAPTTPHARCHAGGLGYSPVAYHVLHRLREPRHPPYALISFLTINPIIHIKYNAHKLTCTVQRLYNTEKNTI